MDDSWAEFLFFAHTHTEASETRKFIFRTRRSSMSAENPALLYSERECQTGHTHTHKHTHTHTHITTLDTKSTGKATCFFKWLASVNLQTVPYILQFNKQIGVSLERGDIDVHHSLTKSTLVLALCLMYHIFCPLSLAAHLLWNRQLIFFNPKREWLDNFLT